MQVFCSAVRTNSGKKSGREILGIDFAVQECVYFLQEKDGYPMFYRKAKKKLAREQRRKLSHCERKPELSETEKGSFMS